MGKCVQDAHITPVAASRQSNDFRMRFIEAKANSFGKPVVYRVTPIVRKAVHFGKDFRRILYSQRGVTWSMYQIVHDVPRQKVGDVGEECMRGKGSLKARKIEAAFAVRDRSTGVRVRFRYILRTPTMYSSLNIAPHYEIQVKI